MTVAALKITAEKMMKSTTKVVGVVFIQHARYIESKKGPEGVRQVEEKMAEIGYNIKFKDIKMFDYYPVGLADLVIIVAKEIFNWSKKDIFNMGNAAPKYSFFVKMFARHFLSLKRSISEAPNYWKKHFTEGELQYDLHEDEKYVIICLKYKVTHPLMCIFYAGYFLRIAQYVVRSSQIDIEEVKCMFKGQPKHEYLIRWE